MPPTEVMRRILVEAARRRIAAKRGGCAGTVPLDGLDALSPQILVITQAISVGACFNWTTFEEAWERWEILPHRSSINHGRRLDKAIRNP